jgi:hypothetical protein
LLRAAALVLQVEVRPELWGRYAAVLNRLQGLLADVAPEGQQQQQHRQRPPQAALALSSSARTSPAAAAVGEVVKPLGCVPCSAGEREALLGLLLGLLAAVEAAVGSRKAPGGGGSVGAAFAKGKEICLSVVKRYRRRLMGSTASASEQMQQQQQQRWPGGGGSAGGSKPRHGPGSSQRVAFGLLLGGLVVGMPLMLAAGCGGRSMAAAGCSAVGTVGGKHHAAAVVLQRL